MRINIIAYFFLLHFREDPGSTIQADNLKNDFLYAKEDSTKTIALYRKRTILIIIILLSTIHALFAQNKIRYGSNKVGWIFYGGYLTLSADS
jgi:hypothetical protein